MDWFLSVSKLINTLMVPDFAEFKKAELFVLKYSV